MRKAKLTREQLEADHALAVHDARLYGRLMHKLAPLLDGKGYRAPDVEVSWELRDAEGKTSDTFKLRAWEVDGPDGGIALATDTTTTDTWCTVHLLDDLLHDFRFIPSDSRVRGLPRELIFEAARARDGYLKSLARKTG